MYGLYRETTEIRAEQHGREDVETSIELISTDETRWRLSAERDQLIADMSQQYFIREIK